MPDTGNVPIQLFQQGSVLNVASGGTLLVASGGSVQVASGGVVNVASGGSLVVAGGVSMPAAGVTFAGTISIGGTVGRWAFGSATLTNGTALVYTGLSQIVSVVAAPLQTAPGTATTSPSSYQIDPARFANGTFYALGLAGTFNYAGAGTFTWTAHGY